MTSDPNTTPHSAKRPATTHPFAAMLCALWLCVAATCTLSGCADDLSGTDSGPVGGAQITHTDQGQGVTLTEVNASDADAWVYLRLSDGAQRDVTTPDADTTWDLAFNRYTIKLNGGVSGPGQVMGQWLEAQPFDDLTAAPANGYSADSPDGDDDDALPDLIFGGWYSYDVQTHVLTPRDGLYCIRDGEGRHFKLQLTSYYDAAGSPGLLSFKWATLSP
jgi:hypothetical protein